MMGSNLIKNRFWTAAIALVPLLSGCEDVIDLKTDTGPVQLVVDGWITNEPGPQAISLTLSASYFDNSEAKTVEDAVVTVTDDVGKVYEFSYSPADKKYIWAGSDKDTLGHIGRKYELNVRYKADEFTANSEIKRVPKVDSIVFQKTTFPFEPEKGPKKGYVAQFYARDFVGAGDTYWVKPIVRGKVQIANPTQISIAYDAAFSAGAASDGLVFILPIRQSITQDSLYSEGDVVGVALHSINNEAFDYLNLIRSQASNGGLLAVPLSNIPSNVKNVNPNGVKALGFFGASAVSKNTGKANAATARPEE